MEKESEAWISYNVRPWYYYWKFFLESGVWAGLLITATVLPVWNRQLRHNKLYLLPLLWMLVALVLLSLLPEKKMRYIFPLLIPASMLMGELVDWWKKSFVCGAVKRTDSLLTSSMRTPKPIIKQWCDPLMTFHKHCSCYSLLTLR